MHSTQVAGRVMRLAVPGCRGGCSLEVFNGDGPQLPLPSCTQRARASAEWLGEEVQRRSVPMPNRMRLKSPTATP